MAQRINLAASFPNLKNLGTVTTPYGGQTSQEAFHPGIDIANKIGTKIPAFAGGTVTEADYGHVQGENNYGNSVIITDAEGNKHRYSHLNRGYVKVGDRVGAGSTIGELGNTGATSSKSGMGDGANLDYRIASRYGKYKNPLTYVSNFLKQ